LFRSSHVEVAPGWLEPLLDRFVIDSKVMVWPIMSNINADNLKYQVEREPYRIGAFKWNM
jgi:hypothetical protein